MSVTFVGETSVDVDRGSFQTDTLRETFRCSSGTPIPGEWEGVPIRPLLDAARAPAGTTHLRVRGSDGFTVCLPISEVIGGLIAFDRNSLDDARIGSESELPRFVAPGISGTRTVQAVDRIEAIELEPGQDAEELEALQLDS